MPFYHAPLRAGLPVRTALCFRWTQWLPQQTLHTSPPLGDNIDASKNHYETLNLPTDASQADIKKSFYSLSKRHHPDHSSHPDASARFQRISEAYHVLGHADKRARYDRDHMRLASSSHHHAARRAGSYSSTGPAGGRPASGLSRRRGTFTGPPPSFYRSGGWGAHGAKRRASHEETTRMAGGAGAAGGGGGGGVGGGGMGPGQDPAHGTAGAAHFDHVGHERMHRRHEEARRARRKGDEGVPVVDTGLWIRFVVVTGIVAGCAYVPYWFAKDGGKKKARV